MTWNPLNETLKTEQYSAIDPNIMWVKGNREQNKYIGSFWVTAVHKLW